MTTPDDIEVVSFAELLERGYHAVIVAWRPSTDDEPPSELQIISVEGAGQASDAEVVEALAAAHIGARMALTDDQDGVVLDGIDRQDLEPDGAGHDDEE